MKLAVRTSMIMGILLLINRIPGKFQPDILKVLQINGQHVFTGITFHAPILNIKHKFETSLAAEYNPVPME